MQNSVVSFDDTEVAFKAKSDADLNRAYWLFRLLAYNWLVKISPPFIDFALWARLPVKGLIRATVFRHFCGGETIEKCTSTIAALAEYNIGTILDYSVEGHGSDADFDTALSQTLATIQQAKKDHRIPFSVFKPTGFGSLEMLEKKNSGQPLSPEEQRQFDSFRSRIETICQAGFDNNVPIYIDAEQTWIQDTVDEIVREMMKKFNREKVMIYNTLQMYRNDRLTFLEKSYTHAVENGYHLGLKIVRGAYMEKERKRAVEMNYPSPIQPDKTGTDAHYNEAIKFCINHLDRVAVCVGTHNENSCLLMTGLMQEKNIPNNHPHIWFSQLYGMSDHISYNLSKAGFNVSKYVPYGPVESVLPYLIRRAQENTSVAGQTSRELRLISMEKKRRAGLKK